MTRTVLTSIAKTCPACGATNTVVAVTTEIRPAWCMNCSRCGAAMAQAGRTQPQEWPGAEGRLPDAAAGDAIRPGGAPSTSAKRRAGPAARRRGLRRGSIARCCTGLHMVAGAALGVVCTILLLELGAGPMAPPKAAGDGVVLAAVLDGDPAGSSAASPGIPEGFVPAGGHPARTPAEWDAAVETALEAELARMEAMVGNDRVPYLAAGGVGLTPVDPELAALAEAALELSRRERQELQRRLKIAEHDPRLVDGIFGPATRSAIVQWQSAVGLPPTGYFDAQALALLESQTEEQFRAWKVAEKRDRRRRGSTTTVASSMPASAGCQRTWSGEITYGQNVLCDFRGLRENVTQLFRPSERS